MKFFSPIADNLRCKHLIKFYSNSDAYHTPFWFWRPTRWSFLNTANYGMRPTVSAAIRKCASVTHIARRIFVPISYSTPEPRSSDSFLNDGNTIGSSEFNFLFRRYDWFLMQAIEKYFAINDSFWNGWNRVKTRVFFQYLI